jgi:hypothetical protein
VGQIEATVFQNVVLPVVYHLGFGGYAEDAFTGTEWLLVGRGPDRRDGPDPRSA